MHYLYEHYDNSGSLLYVGITDNLKARNSDHKKNSPWFPEIKRFRSTPFHKRNDAVIAEIETIREKRPTHNIAHSHNGLLLLSEDKISLKRNIRLAILNSGKTAGEVAEALGVSKMAVSSWVSLKVDALPMLSKLELFCKTVNTTPNDLFDSFEAAK